MAIFGSSQVQPGSPEWVEAEKAGALCAQAGLGVITGGYGGVMAAASRGAASAGGHVIGATAPTMFPGRSGANPYISEEVPAATLGRRLDTLTGRADAAIVMPGSIGTAAELVVCWHINHIAWTKGEPELPTVAVGPVWAELFELLVARAGANPGQIHLEQSVDRAIDWILSRPEIC